MLLGSSDAVPYTSLREHEMFEGISWNDLGPPPKLSDTPYIMKPAESESDISQDLEPGLDNQKIPR